MSDFNTKHVNIFNLTSFGSAEPMRYTFNKHATIAFFHKNPRFFMQMHLFNRKMLISKKWSPNIIAVDELLLRDSYDVQDQLVSSLHHS